MDKKLQIVSDEPLMDETVLIGVGSHLVKVVHIQLNRGEVYLSDKRGVLVVFEVLGEDGFRELSLVENHEPNSRWGPFDNGVIDWLLNRWKTTSNIS